MKISFITTIYNEEKTIDNFLESLKNQTKLPDEIIVVDGGSTDNTLSIISNFQFPISNKRIKNIEKKGNRSVGRNEAIKNATSEIIVCSDSGNILDKDWIKNITKLFKDKNVSSKGGQIDVVAGYYKGVAKNIFQKCLIPYILVMPDKVNPETFLPATRSIAFTKSIWKKVGGFPEEYSHNEDFVFAKNLKEHNAKIIFAKDAIVNWIPRNNLKEAFVMFFRFAYGDAESGIFRPKVILVFIRYILALFLLSLAAFFKSYFILHTSYFILLAYLTWAIKKNYKYVKEKPAFYLLPILQLCADAAIISGTIIGSLKRNKFLFFIIAIYVFLVSITLEWGVPNQNHPFPYHMDEWHQLMAIKAIIKEGTTTIAGAAQIPFLYPVLSGIYLIPFIAFHIIDPFSMKTPLDNLLMQGKLFEILRSINIFFGVGSILLIAKIAKKYLNISYFLPVYFFAISPILLTLSGYFKYDIALLFFIILSLEALFRFGKSATLKNYIYASIACALAFSVKFSAIPLLPLLIFAFFWFIPKKQRQYKWIFFSIFCYITTFIIMGSPNILFGNADYRELLYSNLISGPTVTNNYILNTPWIWYLLTKQYPAIFGHLFYFFSLGSLFYLIFILIFKKNKNAKFIKNSLFLLAAFFLFAISLIPLKIGAIGNRTLVLLPFFALIVGTAFTYAYKKFSAFYKHSFAFLLILIIIFHFFESLCWVYTKITIDPQRQASVWIEKNIAKKSKIGIENIPIYQYLPNIVMKEFYLKLYNINQNYKYSYKIIDCNSEKLPNFVVVTNEDIEIKFLKQSPKKCLVQRLKNENYQKIANFSPDFKFYKFFVSSEDYYLSNLITAPQTISIYKN